MADAEDEASGQGPASTDEGRKSGGAKTSIIVLVVTVAVAVSSAAGAAFGPAIASKVSPPKHAQKAAAADGAEDDDEPNEGPAIETVALEPVIVDLPSPDSELHHLKVGIAVELKKIIPEEEFKRDQPRARAVGVEFLRGISYEEARDPAKYSAIQRELGERIAKAIGKSHVRRVLLTDFLVQ